MTPTRLSSTVGPRGSAGGYIGWLAEAVATTRARLDPNEVAAAAAAARRKSPDQLIDELIIHQADIAGASDLSGV